MFPSSLQIVCDTLSRPVTTSLTCLQVPNFLLIASLLRLIVCVPLFFLYISGGNKGPLIPSNDLVFCVVVGLFSFFSGFLITSAFIVAAQSVKDKYKGDVAYFCTIAFQTAFALALLFALLIRTLLFPNS